jgi:hypothetical protein
LSYLYALANAFVLIEEIEMTLRDLIREATPEANTFRLCVKNALSTKYKDRELPERLEDMTMDDYIALLRDGRNYEHFKPVFGGTRDRTRGKLEPIRKLRNDVFHFRRDITMDDQEQLSICRNWLLRCARKVQARKGGTI